jgi:hypothetical protein
MNGVLSHENQENVVGQNGEVEEEDPYEDGSGNEQILVDTEDEEAQHG